VRDEALPKYRLVASIDARIIEREVIDRLVAWVESGGTLIVSSTHTITDVEGRDDHPFNTSASIGHGRIIRLAGDYDALTAALVGHAHPLDGVADNVWLTEFPDRLLLINLGDAPAQKRVTWRGREHQLELPPMEIIEVKG
jgi:hypothetical protein